MERANTLADGCDYRGGKRVVGGDVNPLLTGDKVAQYSQVVRAYYGC